MRILLVEADLALQTNLKQHLLDANFTLDIASDGESNDLFQRLRQKVTPCEYC